MTPMDRIRVQDSFEAVKPITEEAARLFYGRLFEIAPEVKPLFSGDMEEQGVKLMKMLTIAVSGLNDLDSLVPALQKLGQGHVAYGVKADHYPKVGEALLWTLEQGLGDAFTPEVKASWVCVYGILADTMTSAAYAQAAE
ncbi:MAG: hemin receptor [Rhodobiaceae bacterium]|nr:MAG: hemin receptor [Rhodobiaceae bacterium]